MIFDYRAAQRLCGGPDDGQFVTTGQTDEQATVDPLATVLLLPSGGATSPAPVAVDDLPAAIAANQSAPYYALTFDASGDIVRIEQYFHP